MQDNPLKEYRFTYHKIRKGQPYLPGSNAD
nr:MAG TPA_asm: hypothetical protein [Caudoviricetes sp.]